MKKSFIYGVALAFLCVTGLAGISLADNGPAEIHFETKKPVMFPHAKHQEKFECGECHHSKGDDGKQVAYAEGQEIQKCETCHNADSGMDKKLDSLKDVGHAKCKVCHKEQENKDLAKCKTCHPKK